MVVMVSTRASEFGQAEPGHTRAEQGVKVIRIAQIRALRSPTAEPLSQANRRVLNSSLVVALRALAPAL